MSNFLKYFCQNFSTYFCQKKAKICMTQRWYFYIERVIGEVCIIVCYYWACACCLLRRKDSITTKAACETIFCLASDVNRMEERKGKLLAEKREVKRKLSAIKSQLDELFEEKVKLDQQSSEISKEIEKLRYVKISYSYFQSR